MDSLSGPAPTVQLIIRLEADGRVNISGPINDKIVCYGLLEAAKEAIADYSRQQQQRVQLAPGPLAPQQPGSIFTP